MERLPTLYRVFAIYGKFSTNQPGGDHSPTLLSGTEEPLATGRIYNQNMFESGLKRFIEHCKREGILRDCRKRAFFMGESEKRKEKSGKAAKASN
jgi:ribosomal protein S21